MMRTTRQRFSMLAVGLAAAMALAACGSSSKASVNPAAQPGASTTTTTAAKVKAKTAGPVDVSTAASTSLGSILVDAKGMTLYTLTSGGAPVACTGQCATFWPPLFLASGATTAVGATGVSGLGTMSVTGGMQVTENGDPLYRFSLDKAAGDTKGEGISSFGGTWHVASATAKKTSTAPNTVAPATVAPMTSPPTTTYSYGY